MFTVEVSNTMLGSLRYRGEFATEAEARAYLDAEKARSRSFVKFTIYSGTSRRPIKPVSLTFSGEC